MTPPTGSRDAKRAFLGLLARPLVTSTSDPELHRLATRHLKTIADSARRLGYRVQSVGRAIRLLRIPVAGQVTAPPAPADVPTRRTLSLACCMAACCEDTAGGVTLQRLSDLVREATATPGLGVTAYDPNQLSQRRMLVRAAGLLEHWGVLRRRTRDERLLDDWAEHGAGVGAGYDVDRDALLLLTSPDVLAAALAPEPASEEQASATRTLRMLRALAETPAVLYADLDADDAEMLRATRGLRATEIAGVTGGAVEARAEGLVLVLPDDDGCPTVADWPRARVDDWVGLLMADIAGRAGERRGDGSVTLPSALVDDVAADLHAWRGKYLRKAQKDNVELVRPAAEAVLAELGLLRVSADGTWTLLPTAGRYRDPNVTLATTTATEST
jgi:uncharacterized protein (TIGR02678 family)